jgi:ABC-type multidrug transport system fused ATPase/permease subunit
MQHKEPEKIGTIWRVSAYLFRYKKLFWLTIGLAILSTSLGIVVPMVIKDIIDGIDQSGTTSGLAFGVLIIALLYIGSEVFNGLRIRYNNILEQKVLLDMRRDLHLKLLHLPISFYDQRQSGEISSRVIEDVAAVERALLDGTEQGSSALITIFGVTGCLFYMQPSLAWCVFMPVPILLYAGYRYFKRSRIVWRDVRKSAGDLNSLLVENIQGNRLIQSFALQKREAARFEERAEKLKQKNLQAMFRWAIYNPSSTLITKLGFLTIVAFGGLLLVRENTAFTIGDLIAFFLLANMLYQPIAQLHGINHLIAAGRASGERVFELLDAKIEVAESAQAVPMPKGPIHVQFHAASFQYPGRPSVIENLDLELPPKQITAIVGQTGAGKSTIANLAMRAHDVTAGRIDICGTDIRSIQLESLHQQIGQVAQEPFLFEGSVRANLQLAKLDATEDEMIEALKSASAWDFVNALPQKLDTNIGEKGVRISVGEKQRITIARVLLKNPPFIILDEATASVDTITELKIQKALDQLMHDRTVLIIAHRLSTVKRADRIVVLDKGTIVEMGQHDALIAQRGYYYSLWEHQNNYIH